jgi:signal transduction histidine kinase
MLVERAARLGGRVSLVHDEDGGTTLRMLLPVPR